MQFRNNIINTALLGTEKKQLSAHEFPESLGASVKQILEENTDNETKFLNCATLALGFYKAGIQPIKLPLEFEESPNETLTYCSEAAISILKETLINKYHTLTLLWCKLCSNRKQIIPPQILPELFEWGVITKKLTEGPFRSVIGNRGIWLSKFSEEWKLTEENEEITDWETGSIQQRVKYLKEVRLKNPAEAIDKIKAVWKEENAINREALLESIMTNISKTDEEFLLQIRSDKSQKVKERALQLIKSIPDSEINLRYHQILKESVRLSQVKMLGLISKITLEVKLQGLDEEIYKTGIQSLSSDKKISDNDYILMQLIAEVHPSFWENHFNCSASEVIKIFASKDELKKFQRSLSSAVVKFKSKIWAKDILEQFTSVQVQTLELIDENERSNFAEKLLKENIAEVVNILRTSEAVEWNYRFTKQLLSIMAENPSYYNKNYFEGISIHLPSVITKDLEGFAPIDEWKRNYWIKISQEIKEIIKIKENLKSIFQL